MNKKVFVTCALSGAGDTVNKNPNVPITPEQIAEQAIEVAKAGAAIAHIHVRDPKTGIGSRDPELYKKTLDIIRSANVDVVLNLTAGMGGDLVLGDDESPLPPQEGTDMAGPLTRLIHVRELLPEICTLDCGSMNFSAGGNYVMVNTPPALIKMAKHVRELNVRPELEVFDTGHLVFVEHLRQQGLLDSPTLIQLCMGIPYGAPAQMDVLMGMVHRLPADAIWSSFAIGRLQMPWISVAALAGGNVRVGLEDNLMLEKNVLATNAQLVERAIEILQRIGVGIMTPAETRAQLNLRHPSAS